MKKAAIILTAAIYLIAIVVVAFLGYQAEINNPPVYADDIVLVNDVPFTYYENGIKIYEITESEKEELIEESNAINYKYDVRIYDFEFLYYVLEGKLDVACKPISKKVDDKGNPKTPDKMDLSYVIYPESATISNKGMVTFNTYKDHGSYDVTVSTIDTSNITIYMDIFW